VPENEPGLTEATRQMVLETARDLGYDFCKLRPKRLRRLTFLLHRQHNTAPSSPFYAGAARREEACRKQGIVLSFMAGSGRWPDRPDPHARAGRHRAPASRPETTKPLVLI
jgi:DNA-binding LacI/PurR family transcriptional regulator